MDNIELLQQELEGAYQAAYASPQGTSDWQPVNAAREKLNAAIEAAKTPEQRQIEALNVQIGLLERKAARLDASLQGSRKDNEKLRAVIGAHTGKPTDKAIGLLAMDLYALRKNEDDLAKFVRAGDMAGALRVCINRGLPRAPAADISEQVGSIGLPRMQA
ncbi:hypothetical protein [Pseudomonas sp.]|uniref:hypothetical protein n=1 Tax=Pseudomonas sp. TaxID=306 RepID=UPI0025885484|nr:hypothetical protein [Pseudomonas sp.]